MKPSCMDDRSQTLRDAIEGRDEKPGPRGPRRRPEKLPFLPDPEGPGQGRRRPLHARSFLFNRTSTRVLAEAMFGDPRRSSRYRPRRRGASDACRVFHQAEP